MISREVSKIMILFYFVFVNVVVFNVEHVDT